MALFTFILLPTLPTTPTVALLAFYSALLQGPPQMLGLTLATFALGPLLLRRLDQRPEPLLFRAAAVLTAGLALAYLTGLMPVFWPLATATGRVLLLLLDEAVHLLVGTLQLAGHASTGLVGVARRLLGRPSPAPGPKPDAIS